MEIESKIEANIKCGRCSKQDIISVDLYQHQDSVTKEWVCPICSTKKILTIRRKKNEETKEHDEKIVTKYRYDRDGKRIEEGSVLKETNEKFAIRYPKKEDESGS